MLPSVQCSVRWALCSVTRSIFILINLLMLLYIFFRLVSCCCCFFRHISSLYPFWSVHVCSPLQQFNGRSLSLLNFHKNCAHIQSMFHSMVKYLAWEIIHLLIQSFICESINRWHWTLDIGHWSLGCNVNSATSSLGNGILWMIFMFIKMSYLGLIPSPVCIPQAFFIFSQCTIQTNNKWQMIRAYLYT